MPLGYSLAAQPVEYLSQYKLNQKVRKVTESLRRKYDHMVAAELLFLKREAFAHESEWRASIYCPEADRKNIRPGISVSVDPHSLIDSILLDPRAPQELVDAFTYYFKEKLKFKGRVSRSALYKSPQRIKLVD